VEILIVDDGSTDGTLGKAQGYASAYPDRIRVFSQQNAGACVARNRALAQSEGDYIKFLDADDVLTPDAIAKQVAALDGETVETVPFGLEVHCDGGLRPRSDCEPRVPDRIDAVFSGDPAQRVAWLLENNIQTSCPLHPRHLLEKVGGFDEMLLRAQEYDLHLRIAIAGGRFKCVPHPNALIRDHSAPTRITNQRARLQITVSTSQRHPDTNQMLEDAFGEVLPAPIREVLAKGCWRRVRSSVQAGNFDRAKRTASRAFELDPKGSQVSSIPLRLLYRLPGPIATEYAIWCVKRLLGK
jgi:hypothetical protein